MLIGYGRVSTEGQDLALQTDALRACGCEKLYSDVVSGSKEGRPLSHLIEVVGELQARGVGFRSLREDADTETVGGSGAAEGAAAG